MRRLGGRTLHNHARHELKLYGITMADDYTLYHDIMRLLRNIVDVEKDGAIQRDELADILHKLILKKPLRALQGTKDEWDIVMVGMMQNKRSARVIKDEEGICWDLEGERIIKRDGSEEYRKTRIEFPYTPKTKVIRRKALWFWL